MCSDDDIIRRIRRVLIDDAPVERDVTRTFSYYDDAHLSLRARGITVRTVGGFVEGLPYRQDVKVGSLADQSRKEFSTRTDHPFTQDELDALGFGTLTRVAFVHTAHHTWHVASSGLEVTFDRFYTTDGALLFREIEVESVQDDVSSVERCANRIRAVFKPADLRATDIQKYERVVRSLHV